MNTIPLTNAVRLITPRLTALITTLDNEGNINAAPYSWVYPVSFNPPLIGIGVGGRLKHTYLNAKETRELVVNIVSEEFGQQAVNCEEQHEPGEDLLSKHGLHTSPSVAVKVPRVQESKAILECKVKDILEIPDSDHVILIGEVVTAESVDGINEIKPLMHDAGGKFRSVGNEIMLERRK